MEIEMATKGATSGIRGKKRNQKSVDTKKQLGWVDSLAGDGWKQPFSPNLIFGP